MTLYVYILYTYNSLYVAALMLWCTNILGCPKCCKYVILHWITYKMATFWGVPDVAKYVILNVNIQEIVQIGVPYATIIA